MEDSQEVFHSVESFQSYTPIIDEDKSTPVDGDDNKKPKRESDVSLLLKVHLGLAAIICSVSVIVWHYINTSPLTAIWWWIYPFFFFALTLTAQIHFENRKYWRGLVSIVILIDLMLFLTDGLTSTRFPQWWIFPVGASVMLLLAAYQWKYKELPIPSFAFYEHILLHFLLFFYWLETPKIFPWWIIPFFVLGVPIAILYMKIIYDETRLWRYVMVSLIILNVLIFLVWGFLNTPIPWFLAVWFGSVVITIILYFKCREKTLESMKLFS